jgi:hypothetical protein
MKVKEGERGWTEYGREIFISFKRFMSSGT